ncbi:hypothetical protein PHYBOEH_004977 [Phytophthora boehmeriae]|uniref:Ubiquitin-like domain-containing protein n=1 Tax=Phytophthora boehmeriae TaxID=109152 RepID=A0A8T1WN08_9STRA|nr:hypothetical protein PHYBOEH_004977 [Phytophthora boehmeriae]
MEDDTLPPVSPPAELLSPSPVAQSTADSMTDLSVPVLSPSASLSSRDQESAAQVETSDSSLHLRLKTLDERVFDVLATSSMSVTDFRAKVALVTSIPAPRQRLIYRGKLLKDGAVLGAYDLQDGHTVHLVAKPVATSPTSSVSPNADTQEDSESDGRRLRTRTVSRRRQPGQGELTGNAWNLAVLREALNGAAGQGEATPARPRPLPMLREILDEMNESGQETPAQPVDLEPITQGIMTMRTVLSTAAVEAASQQREEGQDTQLEELEVETQEIQEQAEETTTTTAVQRGQRQFFVGQWLDVKDTVNQWLESTVMDIADGKVLIHYHGWPTRWDEWIDFDSDRIAAFRTRTLHTQTAQRMSPVPTTRVPSAPRVGDNDVRRMVVDVRNLMREMMPHIDRLADLCEDDMRREQTANQAQRGEEVPADGSSENTNSVDVPDQSTPVTTETETPGNEVSEMAHLVAPLFDRFGRLLMDSVGYFDPLLRPELRGTSQRQQERRSTALRHGNGGGASQRQASPATVSMEAQDNSLSIRDLIATSPHASSESNQPRRSIDVHIHAIVAPASLSSFASLTRGNSGQNSGTSVTQVQRPSTPPTRRSFGYSDPRGSGNHAEDDEGDNSQVPLLGAYRHRSHSQQSDASLQEPNAVARELDDFLADDFFGTSFGHEADSDDDPSSNNATSQTTQTTYRPPSPLVRLSSPRTPRSDGRSEGTSTIGVIPEVAETEERFRAREAEQESRQEYASNRNGERSDSSASAGSTSSGASSGFPTFMEVMRRTLTGVRNFVHSDSHDSPSDETTHQAELVSSFSLPSSSSSSSSSEPPSPIFHTNGSTMSRSRFPSDSDVSSIEEDLEEVD